MVLAGFDVRTRTVGFFESEIIALRAAQEVRSLRPRRHPKTAGPFTKHAFTHAETMASIASSYDFVGPPSESNFVQERRSRSCRLLARAPRRLSANSVAVDRTARGWFLAIRSGSL
jgi:hypothetical protein